MTRVHFPVALLALVVALVLIPTSVSAWSNTYLKNGDDYYEIGGGYSTSLNYTNGIVLSNETDPGYARWNFTIAPVLPTYNLSVDVYYSEALGDGPNISLYNWTSSGWDLMAASVGIGSNVLSTTYAPSMNYISPTGSVRVEVYADRGELIDVGTVSVDWKFDDTPPSNPSSNTSTPSTGNWTSDNTIEVTWSGAADDIEVAGYSLLWSQLSTDLPGTTINTTGTSNTSLPLPDGIWYLHIRTVDTAGNWNVTAYDVGPFMVDTTAPAAPDVQGPPAWSNVTTPEFTWNAPADLSGVSGYSYSMDGLPADDINTTLQSVIWSALADGAHTFYVKACDNASNWGSPASYSFSLDTVLPTITIDSPADGAIQNSSTVDVGWTGNDVLSGIGHYEVQIDSGSPINVGTNTSYPFVGVLDGDHIVNVIVFDQAGNQRNVTVSFIVDTVAPQTGLSIEGTLGSSGWYVTPVNVTITSTDATSGVKSIMYNLDSTGWQSFTAKIPISANGVHTLQFYAEDNAGNRNLVSSVDIKVDTSQLYLVFNIQNGTMFTSNSVIVAWTVYNAPSGIDRFESSLDGGTFSSLGTINSTNLASLSEGSHVLTVRAYDNAGRMTEQSVRFDIDTLPPTLSFNVQNATIFASSSVYINWTSSDSNTGIDHFEYSLDGGTYATTGNETFVDLTDVPDGSHVLAVRSYDRAGNFVERSMSFLVDTLPPSLVYSTQGVAYFRTTNVIIGWTATDSVTGILRYEFSLDNSTFASYGTRGSVSINLASIPEGSHVLTMRIFDRAGNFADAPLNFIVDMRPPALIISVQNDTIFASKRVTIDWNSSDNNSGISYFEYRLDLLSWISTGLTASASLDDLLEGSHTITVRSRDRAGNTATRILTFAVDTLPPSLEFDVQEDAIFNSTSLVIAWLSSDGVSGVDSFAYRLDGSEFASVGNATSVNLSGLSESTHILTVRAFDRVGNFADGSLVFMIDTQPPFLAFTIQNNTSFKYSTLNMTWLTQDVGSGVELVMYSLDNDTFRYVENGTWIVLRNLGAGTHVLTVRVFDNAGNFVEKSITFQVITYGSWLLIFYVAAFAAAVGVFVYDRRFRRRSR